MSGIPFRYVATLALAILASVSRPIPGDDGNLLTHLQEPLHPYYVDRDFAKLTTPQWIGEPDVDAVVVLAIDDMREPQKYEAFLRPILERLKQVDGRAPVSIMTNQVRPDDPLLSKWLREGLSLEAHTLDHPCPLLAKGDFPSAKRTYDDCIDRLAEIPGNHPVAFRMPCCDSQNTPSPRFWTEIFNHTTPVGRFLEIDSSVFNVITADDPSWPREFVIDEQGRDRFRKYLPFPSFVNTIENYPYPYVIGDRCWEFPCVVPSDWEAQNLQKPNNPATVHDMQVALDAVVHHQGVYNLVFHPHGWIRSEQIVELIDYAIKRHGRRVKFLTFKEALSRINQHLLAGHPLRRKASENQDQAQVVLLDINHDRFQDVQIVSNGEALTRIWSPHERTWQEFRQTWPYDLARFMLHRSDVTASAVAKSDSGWELLQWRSPRWQAQRISVDPASKRLPVEFQVRDVNRDAIPEVLVDDGIQTFIYELRGTQLVRLPWNLPEDVRLPQQGKDIGLRFVDVDGDGFEDCLFSDVHRYFAYRFVSMKTGWSEQLIRGRRDSSSVAASTTSKSTEVQAEPSKAILPMFVRGDGTNNGVWFHSRSMWVQNEGTDRLPDLVDRLAFTDLIPKELQRVDPEWGGLPGPRSPESSRVAIHCPPGIAVDLVAAEPLITDPIAFDWSPDERLWVVEMRDYPLGMDGQGTGGGRVKILSDVNGDGTYDQATLFLDHLSFPSGIKTWRDGVLISAAPEVFFAADRDGDGVAEVRETLFRGFTEGNQQHRTNGLRFGLDGWLYMANGHSGGVIESIKTGQEVDIRGRDVRLQPDTGEIEVLEGLTQFSRERDEFGQWFGNENSNPMWHYVLEDRYQQRNPHYAPPSIQQDVPERPGPAPVFPRSVTLERFNDFDRANRFTSACGAMVYHDDLLAPEFTRSTYVCEPVHNLIHREVLASVGPTFRSRRSDHEQHSEFFASEDTWSRPVMIRTGPDGALYVADMYRLVIEHPEWIPSRWQQKLNLRAGDEMGRIYRLRDTTETQGASLRPVPNIQQMTSRELVDRLDERNGVQRDWAHQLLLWRNDRMVVPMVRKKLQSKLPQTQVHALYLLDHFQSLSTPDLCSVIETADPRVSRIGLRLAEARLANGGKEGAELGQSIVRRLGVEKDASWSLQAAYSLGSWGERELVGKSLAELAFDFAEDSFVVSAVMSSLTPKNVPFVIETLGDPRHDWDATPATQEVRGELWHQGVRLGDAATQQRAVTLGLSKLSSLIGKTRIDGATATDEAPLRALGRMLRAIDVDVWNQFPEVQVSEIRQTLSLAEGMVRNEDVASSTRIAAMELFGVDPARTTAEVAALHSLISPRTAPAIQLAALVSLESLGDRANPIPLLPQLKSLSPRVQSSVMDFTLSRESWTSEMLQAFASGDLDPSILDARTRQALRTHSSDTIRELAVDVLHDVSGAARAELVRQYTDIDPQQGDAVRGSVLFTQKCAPCHRWGLIGHDVGPDLAAVARKGTDFLLTGILDPNRSVETPYIEYTLVTSDGAQRSGILSEETGSSLTLRGPEGKEQIVLRRDIDLVQSTQRSLMPEGLEKDLSREGMADLLRFLTTSDDPIKRFPGNEPQPSPVRDDGSIRLFAVHAEIRGPSLVFDEKYASLTNWQQIGDRANWRTTPNGAGKFRVILDYACPDETAGNAFVLSVGEQSLSGFVDSTGSADAYRHLDIGTLDLPAEELQFELRSSGPIQGTLFDLRTIYLFPPNTD